MTIEQRRHMLIRNQSHGAALLLLVGVDGVERLRGAASTMTFRHMPSSTSSDVIFFFDMLSILA